MYFIGERSKLESKVKAMREERQKEKEREEEPDNDHNSLLNIKWHMNSSGNAAVMPSSSEDFHYTKASFKKLQTYKKNIKTLKNLDINETTVFIDAGFHRGEELHYLKDIGCKVYGFETNPLHYNNIKRIYSNYKQIELFQNAVTNISGELIPCYYRKDGNFGSMSIEGSKSNISQESKILVESIKLSDFIISKNHDIIDFVKLDVEGAEYKVIEDLIDSGIISKIGAVFFEDHQNKIESKEWQEHRKIVIKKMKKSEPQRFFSWE